MIQLMCNVQSSNRAGGGFEAVSKQKWCTMVDKSFKDPILIIQIGFRGDGLLLVLSLGGEMGC